MELSHFASLKDEYQDNVVEADPTSEMVIRHYALRQVTGTNRWSDTSGWKQNNIAQLRRLYSVVQDDNARAHAHATQLALQSIIDS